jgi:large subunit ribosomal protein L27e
MDRSFKSKYAGKKAVILRSFEPNTTKGRKYGHVVVAGVQHYPRRLYVKLTKRELNRRMRLKPFLKTLNFSHIMPTRYTFDIQGLQKLAPSEVGKRVAGKSKRKLKQMLEDRYRSAKNRWFFTKLRF